MSLLSVRVFLAVCIVYSIAQSVQSECSCNPASPSGTYCGARRTQGTLLADVNGCSDNELFDCVNGVNETLDVATCTDACFESAALGGDVCGPQPCTCLNFTGTICSNRAIFARQPGVSGLGCVINPGHLYRCNGADENAIDLGQCQGACTFGNPNVPGRDSCTH